MLSDDPGPAFRDTLVMLEWKRLCEHLAKHSSTTIGKRLCLQLCVPLQEATSLQLQQEVR
jgi:dsDNA-specific endonuclease/ATPase MutS2